MAKPIKSQWEFGELFQPEALRQVLTVSELTLKVRRLIEKEVGKVWVTGEITNFRLQSSGHSYFCLKDAGSQLNCVLFRTEAMPVRREALRDGQKVILQGELTVYEARGQYQLRVTQVELQGVGALQAAFENLKRKLEAEGLFAAGRKRPLPRYPQRIGIVTSPTGAAIRDVLHVVQRRNPGLEMVIAGCRVQGIGAGEEIAAAIRRLNAWSERAAVRLDLILVTRGGGSLEDLWAFNEEVVARAIFESKAPIVSGVGHEIDFTIADFVADFRAATPSAAAEIITEGMFASREFVSGARQLLLQLAEARLDGSREELQLLRARLARVHPTRRLEEQIQRVDDLQVSLIRASRTALRLHRARWIAVCQRLARLRPRQIAERRREALAEQTRAMAAAARRGFEERRLRLVRAEERLRLLSPMAILERGYSITTDAASGKVIHSVADVRDGQTVRTRLKDGEVKSVVANS